MAVAVIGWDGLARKVPGSHSLDLSAKALMHSVAYVLIGLLVLALAAGYRLLPARTGGVANRSGMEKRWSPSRT